MTDFHMRLSRVMGKSSINIRSFGCDFAIYRHNNNKNKKIISLSLWKGSVGYIFSLSTSLLEWVRLVNRYYPGWYLRFYIDADVLRPLTQETKNEIFQKLRDQQNREMAYEIEYLIDLKLRIEETELWEKQSEEIGPFRQLLNTMRDTYLASRANQELYNKINFDQIALDYASADRKRKSYEDFVDFATSHHQTQNIINQKIQKILSYIDTGYWGEIFVQLMKHAFVEIWFYQCSWGKKSIFSSSQQMASNFHLGTFGSLVRFQAFDDPDVDIVVVRNIEFLTSEIDKKIIDRWIENKKTFAIYAFADYVCHGSPQSTYHNICSTKFKDQVMILATINYRKSSRFQNCLTYEDIVRNIKNSRHPAAGQFQYGIDEFILTSCVKPYLKENPDDFELIHLTFHFKYKDQDAEEAYSQFTDDMSLITNDFSQEDWNYSITLAKVDRENFVNDKKYSNYSTLFNSNKMGDMLYLYLYVIYVPSVFPGQKIRSKELQPVQFQRKSSIAYHFPENKLLIYQHKYSKYKYKYLKLRSLALSHF